VATDGAGGVVGEVRYLPYGGIRVQVGEMPTALGFTGQRLDANVGLLYYRARYYDPGLGRFTQPDTVVPGAGTPQKLNRYSYVQNNPLRFTDPTGHYEFEESPDDPYAIPATPGIMPARRSKVPYAYTTKERRALIHRYGEALKEQKERDSLERFAELVDYAATLYDPQSEVDNFVSDLDAVILGYEGPDSQVHTIGYGGRATSRYWLGANAYPNRGSWAEKYFDYLPNNQMFHFWYYVAVQYFEGPFVANAANICHESPVQIGPCGGPGASTQDYALSVAGMSLGSQLWRYGAGAPDWVSWLLGGKVAPRQVGDWIRTVLSQNPPW